VCVLSYVLPFLSVSLSHFHFHPQAITRSLFL
jgi:hypothetical protein